MLQVSLLLQIQWRPYRLATDNEAEVVSLVVLFVNYLFSAGVQVLFLFVYARAFVYVAACT